MALRAYKPIMPTEELSDLLEDLLVTKEEALKRLAKLAKGVFVIERETGRPVYKIDTSHIRQKDRLVLELVVDLLYSVANQGTSKSNRSTLSERTGIKRTVINARFKDFKDDGWIITAEDGDELTTTGLIKAAELLEKLQRELTHENEED